MTLTVFTKLLKRLSTRSLNVLFGAFITRVIAANIVIVVISAQNERSTHSRFVHISRISIKELSVSSGVAASVNRFTCFMRLTGRIHSSELPIKRTNNNRNSNNCGINSDIANTQSDVNIDDTISNDLIVWLYFKHANDWKLNTGFRYKWVHLQ